MQKATILLLFSLFFILTALSTPNVAFWENETLIGVNKQNYYTIKTCKYLTGTYYHNIDSVFLFEREINTGKVIERKVLRVIDHRDTTSNGDWKHTEMIKNSTNIIEHQKEKEVDLIFQSNYKNMKFKFSKDGLLLLYKDSEELIVTRAYIEKYVDWLNQYLSSQEKYPNNHDFQIRISQTYQSRTHEFFIVESGPDHSDSDFRQTVLVFHHDKLNTARQRINKRKN
jgi:hypothetical protein